MPNPSQAPIIYSDVRKGTWAATSYFDGKVVNPRWERTNEDVGIDNFGDEKLIDISI